MSAKTIDFERFMHPSPQRVDKAVLNDLEEKGQRNNVIALYVQQRLHELMHNAPYWYLQRNTRVQMRHMQGAAFEGYYPTQEQRMDVFTAVSARQNENSKAVLSVLQDIELFVEEQEAHWKNTGYQGDMLRLHQEIDATDHLATRLGGRVLVFGSARLDQTHPEYPATKWLTKMITQHFIQEDGHGEQVITGAGPGIMQASNEGALHGSWDALREMHAEYQEASANDKDAILERIVNQRQQMTSIGVRVQLPFEAGWNDHLHSSLTIKSFTPRKMTLISTAVGRGVSHTKNTKVDWHDRHPALFVLPGGFGTMDEMWDVATLKQCHKMPNIPMFIIGKAMCELVEKCLEIMEKNGTISSGDKKIFNLCEDEIDALHQYADHYELPISHALRREIRSHKPMIDSEAPMPSMKPISALDPREIMDPDRIDLDKLIEQELALAQSDHGLVGTRKRN